jgi:hypothetical protein
MSDDYKTDVESAAELGDWPNCSTPDCPAKVCFRFKNGKCWPCTMEMAVNWYDGMPRKLRELVSRQTEAEYWARRGTE